MRAAATDKLADLLPELHPWHCLVCCNGFGASSLPERVVGYYKGMVLQGETVKDDEAEQMQRIIDMEVMPEIPRHVADAIDGRPVPARDVNLMGLLVIREL
jgi:hypothetical protein